MKAGSTAWGVEGRVRELGVDKKMERKRRKKADNRRGPNMDIESKELEVLDWCGITPSKNAANS